MYFTKRLILTLLFFKLSFAAFPEKPLTFIVHSKPGSAIDITTRQLTKVAAKYTDATFLVENKSGGSGIVAMRTVLNKPADGYTVLAVTKSFISTVLLTQSGIQMDDFYFAACLVIDPEALITNRHAAVHTLEQIISDAKQKKGKQKWLGPLVGGVDHLMAVKTWQKLGIQGEWIPYEGGSDAVAALLGMHGVVYVGNPVDIKGRPDLMMAAVSARERLKNFPNVPTFMDKGFNLQDDVLWRGYALKKGTDVKATAWLEDLFKKISADPEWLGFISNTAAQPVFIGHRDFDQMVQKDQLEARKYLALAGILQGAKKQNLGRNRLIVALGFLAAFLLALGLVYVFKKEWLQPEVIISLFLIFLSAFLYWQTFDFPQGKLSRTAGPAAMPRLWLWGILLFSLWLIVDKLRSAQAPEKKQNANQKKALLLASLTVVYLLIMQYMGYYVATFLFITAGAYLLSFRKHVVIFLTSAGFSVLSYFVFYKILGVPLPLGWWG